MIRVLVALASLMCLAGCNEKYSRLVRTPVAVEVPVPVRTPIPAELVQPCRVTEPAPACSIDGRREYCNGQLIAIRDDYRAALRTCDARMTRIRALDREPAR